MTLPANPAVQPSVYAREPRTQSATPAHRAERLTVHLVLENSPMSLGRVFGLVGTVSIVPEASGTLIRADGLVELQLTFSAEEPRKIDLLCRKLSQLTETVSIWVGVGSSAATKT